MISATDPDVLAFLKGWHEAARADFGRYSHLDYDTYAAKTAHERAKYIALDENQGASRTGRYLLDRATGEIWHIKAYGVPNKRRPLGVLASIVASGKYPIH